VSLVFTNGPATSTGRPISPSPPPSCEPTATGVQYHQHACMLHIHQVPWLQPSPDDVDPMRSKMEIATRKASLPVSVSSRPSPPFRTQPSSYPPENKQAENSKHPPYPSSPLARLRRLRAIVTLFYFCTHVRTRWLFAWSLLPGPL
jgi:hypothetical protein